MIKVCHIITKLELGGAQQNTLYTVQHLDRNRFIPLLMTGSEGLLIDEARQYPDVRTYFLPQLLREIRPHHDLAAFRALRRRLYREQHTDPATPLIVHTHSSKAGILGRWAAKSAGVPIILHSIHGFGFHPYQPRPKRWLFIIAEWLTAKITSHFIAVSSANITTGTRLGLFSPSRVSLIRSGIEIPRFQLNHSGKNIERHRELIRKKLDIPSQKRIIGMIACLKPQKAPLDFVRVMKRVSQIRPEAHAIMVGDGELRPQVERLIAQENLKQAISLLGWRTDIPDLLHGCEMLVLTSRWEGLPRVCPQAMAAGLPIVATNVDGIPEAVHDGVNGFLRSPGDVPGIADKIIYLLAHPDIAQRMGQEGQRRVGEFDINRMVTQQEHLYQSLVQMHNN
ncbi:glycosyltransferase [candidate division KSB3 bacterium]|uniref:Glycosyltransferase n=1 Tax=candidate division KSB3 bacterium TaxID=2044937 RepID=A0A9D5Q4V3_9BACT|nr:glycosyltransferase [candidate division KSB3 bacterium]MBD3323940.1 glycosyltransferase [candidate division KSB3 bacterium]